MCEHKLLLSNFSITFTTGYSLERAIPDQYICIYMVYSKDIPQLSQTRQKWGQAHHRNTLVVKYSVDSIVNLCIWIILLALF